MSDQSEKLRLSARNRFDHLMRDKRFIATMRAIVMGCIEGKVAVFGAYNVPRSSIVHVQEPQVRAANSPWPLNFSAVWGQHSRQRTGQKLVAAFLGLAEYMPVSGMPPTDAISLFQTVNSLAPDGVLGVVARPAEGEPPRLVAIRRPPTVSEYGYPDKRGSNVLRESRAFRYAEVETRPTILHDLGYCIVDFALNETGAPVPNQRAQLDALFAARPVTRPTG